MTPEGKVKKQLNNILKLYGSDIYTFMPVPSGYGESSLDYILCVQGIFVAVETKAPGGKLTARQQFTSRTIRNAGGKVFVIDSDASAIKFIEFLNWVLQKTHTPEEVTAWPGSPKYRSARSSKK